MKKPIAIGFVVCALALAGVVLFWPEPPPRRAMPNPNGYDDLVKAGSLIVEDPSGYRTNTLDELRLIVAANSNALVLARAGLARECRMPDDFDANYITRCMTDFVRLKKLAVLFAAESRYAQLDNRPADALKSALETTAIGVRGLRGGVLITRLVGCACENIGVGQIGRLVPFLGTNECRLAIQSLNALESQREPFSETVSQERRWMRQANPTKEIISGMIEQRSFDPSKKACDESKESFQTAEKKFGETLLALAARLHELENGRRATNITELVPRYLSTAPRDPATGSTLPLL